MEKNEIEKIRLKTHPMVSYGGLGCEVGGCFECLEW